MPDDWKMGIIVPIYKETRQTILHRRIFVKLRGKSIIQDLEDIKTPRRSIKLLRMTMMETIATVNTGQNTITSFGVNRG